MRSGDVDLTKDRFSKTISVGSRLPFLNEINYTLASLHVIAWRMRDDKMDLNEFFPHQVCINLDTRPDRWKRITARFVEHGIDQVIRFPAVDGKRMGVPSGWDRSPGEYGCLQSHLAVVEQARNDAKPSVLIFEDDVVLAQEFNRKFSEYVEQLPDDWDMVFFGGLHGQPLAKVSDNVIRVTHSLSTYTYALKHTIYDSFIELNRRSLTILDENTRALQKRFNCYCFTPHLAWVEEDYSDVRGERVNLWWLKESLVLYGPEIDEILKNTVAVIAHYNDNSASLRNLLFTTDYLSHGLPGITFSILEHGDGPSLNRNLLPHGCHLERAEGADNCNLSHLLKRGFEIFESNKDFFIFLDSDVFLTFSDVRGNLLKCLDYDIASSFQEIYNLNERDTQRILNGDLRWDYDGTYQARKKSSIFDSAYIVTRKGMRILSEWENSSHQSEDRVSMRVEELLRVYESPNLARRLSSR